MTQTLQHQVKPVYRQQQIPSCIQLKRTAMSGKCLTDFQKKELEQNLQRADLHRKYRTRIRIMLLCDQGRSQAQICTELGCSRETARHWIVVAELGQAHRWSSYPVGRPNSVNQTYLDRLRELLVQCSPREFGYSFQQWTASALSQCLAKELGIEIGARHINRLLRGMGLSTRSKKQQSQPVCQQTKFRIADLSS